MHPTSSAPLWIRTGYSTTHHLLWCLPAWISPGVPTHAILWAYKRSRRFSPILHLVLLPYPWGETQLYRSSIHAGSTASSEVCYKLWAVLPGPFHLWPWSLTIGLMPSSPGALPTLILLKAAFNSFSVKSFIPSITGSNGRSTTLSRFQLIFGKGVFTAGFLQTSDVCCI